MVKMKRKLKEQVESLKNKKRKLNEDEDENDNYNKRINDIISLCRVNGNRTLEDNLQPIKNIDKKWKLDEQVIEPDDKKNLHDDASIFSPDIEKKKSPYKEVYILIDEVLDSLSTSTKDVDILPNKIFCGKGNEEYEYKNLCIICGIDIGPQNPRQLCCKTYCINDFFVSEE